MSVIDIPGLGLDVEASLFGHGLEEDIPKWRGDAIGCIGLLVVMQGMVDPQMPEDVFWWWESVNGIVYTQVSGIAGYKSTGKRNAVLAQEQPVKQEENGCQGYTDQRRHSQA